MKSVYQNASPPPWIGLKVDLVIKLVESLIWSHLENIVSCKAPPLRIPCPPSRFYSPSVFLLLPLLV